MEIPTDQYWNMLDELVNVDEERLMTLEVLLRKKERVAKSYNKKVNQNLLTLEIWFGKYFRLWTNEIVSWANGYQSGKDHFKLLKYFQIVHTR